MYIKRIMWRNQLLKQFVISLNSWISRKRLLSFVVF